MAAPLSAGTVEKQRSYIHLLWSEGVKPSEIYRTMKVQYGDSCVNVTCLDLWKNICGGHKFADDDEVMEAVRSWLEATPKSFFLEGIRKLVDRWTECDAKRGDCVGK